MDHGKGGDYLFRWGNPQAYDRGSNQNTCCLDQHVNWIPQGYPGEGNLIIFNNNYTNNTSAVFEIIPPLSFTGNYNIEMNQPYGLEGPVWMHTEIFILKCKVELLGYQMAIR